jgi:hypothetical protein
MSTNQTRSRWAAVGAAIAITLGAGGIGITHATTSSGEKPIYLPIEPCRLADTRPAFQVGPRSAPLGPNETYTLSGQGAVGNCNLKTGTTALSLNVTAINATAPTFVTLFPAGTPLPVASHLNPLPGQGPVPNAVNVDLNGAGQFSIYNLAGNVDIIIDVVGVYDTHNHNDQYLSAVVAPAAANPVIVRGQGATSVVRFATGSFRVTFDRDVSDCAWVASYGQPDDSFVDAKWATVRGRDVPNEVGVVIRDTAGAQVDGQGFHLLAICP